MNDAIVIKNGSLVDPANMIDMELGSLHIQNEKFSNTMVEGAKVLDASNCVVLPGGIDIHTHVFGPMADLAREVAGDAGIGDMIPPVAVAAQKYAGMGYTTVVDPAIYPAFADKTHLAGREAPIIDKCFLALLGPKVLVDEIMENGDKEELKSYIAWLVEGAGAYGLKVVTPKSGEEAKTIAEAVTSLNIPHPVHLHLPHLGEGGSFQSAIETITALEGVEAHIAHMQFHCYENICGEIKSRANKIADAVNENKNITIDVGQIVFGKTVTVSADTSLMERIEHVTKGKGKSLNAGCGEQCISAPYTYDPAVYINALQWVTGLELFLSINDPWQVCLSTDHPNGGSFTAYPDIIKLLMDKDYRKSQLSKIHLRVREKSALKNINREYSLYEIAVVTRAGPARRLGLINKGSLFVGADADVAIYRKGSDIRKMFTHPAWVIKGGEIVAEDGVITKTREGKTFGANLPVNKSENAKWKNRVAKFCPDGLKDFPIDNR